MKHIKLVSRIKTEEQALEWLEAYSTKYRMNKDEFKIRKNKITFAVWVSEKVWLDWFHRNGAE